MYNIITCIFFRYWITLFNLYSCDYLIYICRGWLRSRSVIKLWCDELLRTTKVVDRRDWWVRGVRKKEWIILDTLVLLITVRLWSNWMKWLCFWIWKVKTQVLHSIIRLILPVSHFSVKRLIHACVWHCYAMPADGSLKQRWPTLRNRRITLLIVRLIREMNLMVAPIIFMLITWKFIGWLGLVPIENGSLIYQLLTVVYWTTVALTDNGELGFGSGENAWETAFTAKVGSRSENFSNKQCLKRWLSVSTTAFCSWLEWETFRPSLE